MILATWNVNSIRARLGHAVQWIHAHQPDIFCFQELKCRTDDFPRYEFETEGYQCVILGQKARNGVATVTRELAYPVQEGFDNGFDPENSRFLSTTIAGIHVINVYVPNGQSPDSPFFEYKRDFFRELRRYLVRTYSPDDPVAIVGDFNVAPEDHDVYNPDLLRGTICFHPDEQADFAYLKSWGLVDLFRKMNPDGNYYSWWDYRAGGYPRNRGMRLDHILVTKSLAEACVSCVIDREPREWERPSDHAPVYAEFSDISG
jgi:exodeoxyribonuclease-3